MDIEKLLISRSEINEEIIQYRNKLKFLENKKKKLNRIIYENCNHNWIYDYKFFTYDERPKICTICKSVK